MNYSRLMTTVSRLFSSACGKNELLYRNPYLKLKDYLEIPILDEGEIFTPDIRTIIAAQELFIPKKSHEIKKIISAIDSEKFPNHDLPEVMLFGRSNAGKSSLLKAIFQNVPGLLIKTSKLPGHTKSAQFFQVGSKLCIIDMPGTGENSPEWFRDVADGCLRRKNCVRAFLLVDGEIGFQKDDDEALSILDSYKVPYAIVMTKIDTAKDSRLLRNVLHLQNIKFSIYCYPQPFLVSSVTFEGLGNLLAFIAHITGNLNVDNIKCISS